MTFPSAQMSWFVHYGDWNFTSACEPSVLPAVPSVFISSWSKYNSLWLSVSFAFSRAFMPCFFVITGRVGRHVLANCTGHAHLYPVVCFATSATSRSISGTVFEGICVQHSTLSTTMTKVITVILLWLTTVPLILRRPPIMCCAVVGCIMPWFACRLCPTITHCMHVRFGSEALQLLFCSQVLETSMPSSPGH